MQPGQTATNPHPMHTYPPSTTALAIRCCTHAEATFPRRTPINTPPSPLMASHCDERVRLPGSTPHQEAMHLSLQRRQLRREIRPLVLLTPHRCTRPTVPLPKCP